MTANWGHQILPGHRGLVSGLVVTLASGSLWQAVVAGATMAPSSTLPISAFLLGRTRPARSEGPRLPLGLVPQLWDLDPPLPAGPTVVAPQQPIPSGFSPPPPGPTHFSGTSLFLFSVFTAP